MTNFTRSLFLSGAIVAAICLTSSFASSAQAQWGWAGGGFASQSPFFFGQFDMPYASGRVPTPPYFALHPPVYYSYPVPRTYGHSPFAYPGTFRTPDPFLGHNPGWMMNPHVEPTEPNQSDQAPRSEETSHRTAASRASAEAGKPGWVYNPFVLGTAANER